MSDTRLTAPGILTRAADILSAQGWIQNGDYHHRDRPAEQSPVDLASALALAAGVDMHSNAALSPVGVHADAVMLLAAHLLDAEAETTKFGVGRWLDELTDWQDEDGCTADQVIMALRAAADVPVPPVLELAAAIADALDLPAPATAAAAAARAELAGLRAAAVRAALKPLTGHPDMDDLDADVRTAARVIEQAIDWHPITYQTKKES